jgi:c-di-GMP-binding flagellar brake protein YcgR
MSESSSAATTNKRQHRRFQVRVPVFISVDGEVYRKTVRLQSRDVSAGGLSFETGREVPVSAESRVIVARLGDLEDPALIEGRVARVQLDETTGRYVVGIEFTRFLNVTPEELVERLERAWQG